MKIAVTGRSGQVLQSLIGRGTTAGHMILPVGRPELDLADAGPNLVLRALDKVEPDVIISAAAYTAVDKAESQSELAFAVNANGAAQVARAAAHLGVPLVHLSTDYVFSGESAAPYRETDETGPTTVYGATKLAGEDAVRSACANSVILRTAWVYSPFGTNFVKTMLRLADSHNELRVVADQNGNPTSAFDIADGVLAVAQRLVDSDDQSLRGVFHIAGAETTNWAEFAQAAFAESGRRHGPVADVVPIATAEYPTAAKRPSNSRLDVEKIAAVYAVRLPGYSTSLGSVVEQLLASKTGL